MPVFPHCEQFPLRNEEIEHLWDATRQATLFSDEHVALQCVSRHEMRELNKKYRKKDSPTNVLTFSYGEEEHDVAICMEVATTEATQRTIPLRDYVALLLAHAFLHVTGMDHEESEEESARMQAIEKEILTSCGFVPRSLSDVY